MDGYKVKLQNIIKFLQLTAACPTTNSATIELAQRVTFSEQRPLSTSAALPFLISLPRCFGSRLKRHLCHQMFPICKLTPVLIERTKTVLSISKTDFPASDKKQQPARQ